MAQVVIERNIEAERHVKTLLKTKVKELSAHGRDIRLSMTGTKGPERDALWNDKREHGRTTRAWLLAYGLWKGKPYYKIEKFARQLPSIYDILDCLAQVQGTASRLLPRDCQVEALKFIKAWLENKCTLSAEETLTLVAEPPSSVTPSENSPSDTQPKRPTGIGPAIRSFFSKLLALPTSIG